MSKISFIVIGRNEGWKLTRCLKSIIELIKYNNLSSYEIIYVDSNSTDDSIRVALSFNDISVFRISGIFNAAIARNIGANESTGDVLFFIDGDMELNKDFLPAVYTEADGLSYSYCSGHIFDYIYDSNNSLVGSRGHTFQNKLPDIITYDYKNGGIFLIKRELWFQVGGMRTKYRRSQDLDLAIRLYKKGIKLVRIPQLVTSHHTFDYHGRQSLIKQISRGYMLYPAVLFRDHCGSIPILKQTVRTNYTALLLIVLIAATVAVPKLFTCTTGVYLVAILLRLLMKYKERASVGLFLERYLMLTVKDIVFIVSLIFFFPQNKKTEYVSSTDECFDAGYILPINQQRPGSLEV